MKRLGWKVLPHPPYSPNVTPSDYCLFRSMEYVHREKKFRTATAIKFAFEDHFTSKSPSFYKKRMESLPKR